MRQFEVAPPPDVWSKISSRLDEEFVASDSQVAASLDDASIVPPAFVWDKIITALNTEPATEHQPAKVIPLYKRIAVAAIVIGILFVAGLYFLNSNKSDKSGNINIVKTVPQKSTPPAATEKEQLTLPDTGNSALVANSETAAPKLKKEITRPVPKPRDISSEIPGDATDASFSSDYSPKPEQAPLYDLQTVSALQPVSVSAPPLRDNKGNIIMDASLISHPDDEYIAVTGPNGKQTKISSKFLSCLGYINASANTNDADSRGIQCKNQFEEWRKKIIAQPAFIPTANNFFDIFELKDLLQEM